MIAAGEAPRPSNLRDATQSRKQVFPHAKAAHVGPEERLLAASEVMFIAGRSQGICNATMIVVSWYRVTLLTLVAAKEGAFQSASFTGRGCAPYRSRSPQHTSKHKAFHMQPRKIPDAVRREIIGRAWDGETFARIARDLGVPPHQVSTIAVREGGFPTRAEVIELQRDAICAAYEESGSMGDVAKRFALSEQSVSNALHARGVRRRKRRQR